MVAENTTEVHGLQVRWLEAGSGPAALLLHGASLGSSADVFADNLEDLAAHGVRAIAVDFPGFGGSDNPKDHSIALRTRFVPAFIDALALGSAGLVGHSQAGRIAVSLALERNARISRVVVLGTSSLLPPLPGAAKADAEGAEGGMSEPSLEETRRALEKDLFDLKALTADRLHARQRMSTGKNFQAFLSRRQARWARTPKQATPPWRRLGEVQLPLRLLYGRQDRGNAERRVALALELVPGLDLHLIDRCKHLVMWDAAKEFAALCGPFLAGKS